MASLNPEQVKNIRTALSIARRRGASPKVTKALVEAMSVESNFTNVPAGKGDRDSVGVLQQRPSQGWKGAGSVETSVNNFLDRAIPSAGKYGNAGTLAQGVQRSGFPERYGQRAGQASRIISQFAPGLNADGSASSGFKASVTPGVDNKPARDAAIIDYFRNQRGRPGALVALKGQLDANQDTPSTINYSGGSTGSRGSAPQGGSRSSGQLKELIYNGGGGYAVKNGQIVSGPEVYGAVWNGHKDHVHVASGPKQIVALGKLAQEMGLHVGENSHFGGVSPVHVKDSYHYKDEAIDVSGDRKKMAEFARRVRQKYGL